MTCLTMIVLRRSRTYLGLFSDVFTCTKLLRSSSKLRMSDSTMAWFAVEQSEHMSEEEGEKRGHKCPLTKPESKAKIKTRISKRRKCGNQM